MKKSITIESQAQIQKIENEEKKEEEEEEVEEEYQEEEEVEKEDEGSFEEEEEEEAEEIAVKKRRCQRRKKRRLLCFDWEGEDEGNIEGEEEEECEDEEEEDEESFESDEYSYTSSILSAITFEWNNKTYEFEELCDTGEIANIFEKSYVEPEIADEYGQNRYLKICRVLCITPTLRFWRALTTDEVDLSFRNVTGKTIRAMCAALQSNVSVEKLMLKHNKLETDDCYYIGLLFYYNEKINFLDVTGCRMGPEGLEKLVEHMARNETLVELNLSKCRIEDQGMKILSHVLVHNNSIQILDLSYNNLGDGAAEALGFALRMNKCLTDLNLQYNNLFDPNAMKLFFRGMTANDSITNLNLAWNAMSGIDIGAAIGNFLRRNSTIVYLDLSDNRLEGLAALEIKKGLGRSRSLETLKLGKNPLSPGDLDIILKGAKTCLTLQVLDLEDLWVEKSFIKILKKIQAERELTVNFAGMFGDYQILGPDYPKVILQRAQFEAQKPKKAKARRDFGHLMWTLGDEPMTGEEFMTRVKKFKAKINKELYPELIKQFLIPKAQLIDVVAMKSKYLSIFPDSTPPPIIKVKGEAIDIEALPGDGKVLQILEEEIRGIQAHLQEGSEEDMFDEGEEENEYDNKEEEEEEENEEEEEDGGDAGENLDGNT